VRRKLTAVTWVLVCVASLACTAARCDDDDGPGHDTEHAARALIAAGRHTFRFDTFGDEAFWGDTLRLHQAIEGSRFGGVGAGVSPKTALAVGLKVDVDALPGSLIQALRRGQVNLDDPATTLALLKLNSVIGVTGFFNPGGTSLRSVGIQCALCHSAVDNSLAPGIGHRLDGWANRDLNVGAIVGLAPDLSTVATLEMHGKGTFFDPRLADAEQFPVAARAGFDNVRNDPDLVSPKLPALHVYQLALAAPAAPRGSFSAAAAARGQQVFSSSHCDSCHVPPTFTEPGWNLHTPAELGVDDFEANRAPARGYRTAPLKGLWTHQEGGFYHDGRFATLAAVVDHYDVQFGLHLSPQEKKDLVEYLKSL